MKKTYFLILLLTILFLSFSTVHAFEDNANQTVGNNEKTFEDVQKNIDNSKSSNTIILEGIYYASAKPINVNKSVTIKGTGDGTRLYAGGKSGILNIEADNVTLINIIFSKGNSEEGGAIYNTGNNLKIINCRFTSNQADYGGSILSKGNNLSIINSQFTTNTAKYSGGAIQLEGNDNYVNGCVFKTNYGYHVGGSVAWVGENGFLTNSKFTKSSSSVISQYGDAVVWMGVNGKLTKSYFSGFEAKKSGASVYWKGNNGSLNYCIFEDNVSPNDLSYFGNPNYANYNYWGVNINSSEEFNQNKFIYYNNTFHAPQNWVNINQIGDWVNFTLNTHEKLLNTLPDYELSIDNLKITLSNNFYKFKKSTNILCSNLIAYTPVDSNKVNYFKITLKDENSKIISSKKIYMQLNGGIYEAGTDKNGVAKFRLNLKNPSVYNIKISFKEDIDFKSTSKTAKITIKKQKTTLKVFKSKSKQIKFTLKNQFKKPISKKTVKLTINKKTYKAKTNSKGIVTFKVKLKVKKKYKFTAKFSGNNFYNKIFKKGVIKIR